MKNFIQIVAFLFIGLFSTNMLCAQNEDNKPQTPSFQELAKNGTLQLSSDQTTTPTNFQFSPISSSLIIQQIGSNNSSNLSIASSNSAVKLSQEGNSNAATLQLDAQNIQYSLLQQGDFNNYLHSNSFGGVLIDFSATQNGQGNTIEKFGSNNLSDKMVVTQTGDNMSMLIRSF